MSRTMRLCLMLAAGLLAAMSVGCGESEGSNPHIAGTDGRGAGGSGGDRPIVVATTTMIADLARVLGGQDITVVGIMKTGEDPHVYDVRPNDARDIARADLVLMNGFHLEATLGEVVEHNASGKVVHLAEEAGIEPINSAVLAGAPDPHVWMDPTLWARCTEVAAKALAELLPEKTDAIAERKAVFLAQVEALNDEVRTRFEAVPKQQRVIVTSHDAFAYFGRAYDIEVHGVIGISTEQQPRPQDVQALHSLVRERDVKAVFIETSTSATLNAIVEKVARETGAAVGGTLYSDSLGEPGTPEGTYLGMMRYNAKTMADALGTSKN